MDILNVGQRPSIEFSDLSASLKNNKRVYPLFSTRFTKASTYVFQYRSTRRARFPWHTSGRRAHASSYRHSKDRLCEIISWRIKFARRRRGKKNGISRKFAGEEKAEVRKSKIIQILPTVFVNVLPIVGDRYRRLYACRFPHWLENHVSFFA